MIVKNLLFTIITPNSPEKIKVTNHDLGKDKDDNVTRVAAGNCVEKFG